MTFLLAAIATFIMMHLSLFLIFMCGLFAMTCLSIIIIIIIIYASGVVVTCLLQFRLG
jgi:hypothetical protein